MGAAVDAKPKRLIEVGRPPQDRGDQIIDAILATAKSLSDWFLELLKRVGVVALVGVLASRTDDNWIRLTLNVGYVALFVHALYPTLRAIADARREVNWKHRWGWVAFAAVAIWAVVMMLALQTALTVLLDELISTPTAHP